MNLSYYHNKVIDPVGAETSHANSPFSRAFVSYDTLCLCLSKLGGHCCLFFLGNYIKPFTCGHFCLFFVLGNYIKLFPVLIVVYFIFRKLHKAVVIVVYFIFRKLHEAIHLWSLLSIFFRKLDKAIYLWSLLSRISSSVYCPSFT